MVNCPKRNWKLIREAFKICLSQHFEADFLWKVSLTILNSGIILKTFTPVENISSKMYKLACVFSEDSNQYAHLHSLISLSFLPEEMLDLWLHVEDSDQTVRMCRLIWVFDGPTCHKGQIYFNIALVLQDQWLTIFTRPANTCTCPLKAYAIKNTKE